MDKRRWLTWQIPTKHFTILPAPSLTWINSLNLDMSLMMFLPPHLYPPPQPIPPSWTFAPFSPFALSDSSASWPLSKYWFKPLAFVKIWFLVELMLIQNYTDFSSQKFLVIMLLCLLLTSSLSSLQWLSYTWDLGIIIFGFNTLLGIRSQKPFLFLALSLCSVFDMLLNPSPFHVLPVNFRLSLQCAKMSSPAFAVYSR